MNETTQLGSMNETTQLVSRNETTQLCTAVDRLQPPAPPLQQNRLFLPTSMLGHQSLPPENLGRVDEEMVSPCRALSQPRSRHDNGHHVVL
ncbi:hypothetical protein TNCV_2629631 [Trichonephila clavipes]|uniref:Uncharacterized protein n=1 Tax=Trichonephila clavipes TaxID=2585209 RepID=A0A8X6VK74_TRICX|nr:hypothetical protein TNCV_2629631 [Trichonephila clavipes]